MSFTVFEQDETLVFDFGTFQIVDYSEEIRFEFKSCRRSKRRQRLRQCYALYEEYWSEQVRTSNGLKNSDPNWTKIKFGHEIFGHNLPFCDFSTSNSLSFIRSYLFLRYINKKTARFLMEPKGIFKRRKVFLK